MVAAPRLTEHGITVRDLNKNGRIDPYEDPRVPIAERVEDLLAQMTLAEKAGLMFHLGIGMNADGTLAEQPGRFSPYGTSDLVLGRMLNHFNVYAIGQPSLTAAWHNSLQDLAEQSRLGIPVTISSDPRNAFTNNPATSFAAERFSLWPEPIGMAAIGDPALVEQFGDIARQEYLAVGIRVALHPVADLATEPRWGRISGTFGEDADLASSLLAAYIRGFQGPEVGPQSVACMTKHFPGGGPQKDGEDPHFAYGKEQIYPGNNFDYHLKPFHAAFAVGTAQIMPYYGMPVGTDLEPVGFGFNKGVITDMLRGTYGFDGIVCTDWKLLTPAIVNGKVLIEAKDWGVEHLSLEEKVKKAIDAGVDQFGGEACPEVVIALVQSGQISEARIDQSVRRLLREKFRLGLFDQPHVDLAAADAIVGRADFRAAGAAAQRRAITLLKNRSDATGTLLPLTGRPKIYIEGIAAEVAANYAEVVAQPEQADLAIIRLSAPYQPREGFLESMFHAGDLDFKQPELDRILRLLATIPTIVDIYLDRPAVIPKIASQCAALLADFGASDAALLDVLFGQVAPQGHLPFELPRSMDAVRAQKEDLPYDSVDPLFPYGYGLSY